VVEVFPPEVEVYLFKLIFAVCLSLITPITLNAESWRDLVPLHSTRKDIEARLGKPLRSDARWMVYEFSNEDVSFFLAESESCAEGARVPEGTIIFIEVKPTKTRHPSEFGLAEVDIIKFEPSETGLVGFQGYVNEEKGLVIRTDPRTVDAIFYLGTAKERASCKAFYPAARTLGDVPYCFLCPLVVLSSPDEIEAGSLLTFSANVGAYLRPTTLKWTVSAGRILAGQGTHSITVDSRGLDGRVITGTLELQGVDRSCPNKASSSTQITKPRRN